VFNAPGSDALVALERIRAGLRRPDLEYTDGVRNQPDEQTYVHHTSFLSDGRIVSAYSFETGFRAVVDYPIVDGEPGSVDAGTNMQTVEVLGSEIDVNEATPANVDQEIDRP
jgi:hypothetical protein